MTPPFNGDFWRGLAVAADGLVFLRRAPDRVPELHPGDDADVWVGDLAGAVGWLGRAGFERQATANPDQTLMRWWPRAEEAPVYVDVCGQPTWAGGWYWAGPLHGAWQSLAHGLVAKGDWRHFRRRFDDADLLDHPAMGRWGGVLAWALRREAVPVLWLLCGCVGLRWSGRRWLASAGARWRHRLAKMRRRRGLEIGFAGVDGSGKSSTVAALARTGLPAKVLYMGARPGTVVGRVTAGYRGPGRGLIGAADIALRRISGMVWARRGRVVLYDRDPACRAPRRASRLINALYAPMRAVIERPVDASFFLDGDVETFWRRKGEHGPATLARLRADVVNGYGGRRVRRVDTAAAPLPAVVAHLAAVIRERHAERAA